MTMTVQDTITAPEPRLPLHAMILLALAAFVTLLTEIMPAGLLSAISDGLNVTQAAGGQFITAFALGALSAALPSAAFTHAVRRKPLLLAGLTGFVVVNGANACIDNLALALVVRFLAGCCGGLIWAMFAGYATRLAPVAQRGRAIALAGSGVTLALVLGAPLSAMLGQLIGWRGAFAGLAGFSALLVLWCLKYLPDAPGSAEGSHFSVVGALRRPGVAANLALIFTIVAAHSLLYVYIEPLLGPSGMAEHVDALLLIFGGGSVAGLLITGILIDRYLARLTLTSILLFILAALIMTCSLGHPLPVCAAIILWGITTGGFAALTQSVMTHVAGSYMDTAQAMATTAWNLAVSCGGLLGGLLLTHGTIEALPLAAIALLCAGLGAYMLRLHALISMP